MLLNYNRAARLALVSPPPVAASVISAVPGRAIAVTGENAEVKPTSKLPASVRLFAPDAEGRPAEALSALSA